MSGDLLRRTFFQSQLLRIHQKIPIDSKTLFWIKTYAEFSIFVKANILKKFAKGEKGNNVPENENQ